MLLPINCNSFKITIEREMSKMKRENEMENKDTKTISGQWLKRDLIWGGLWNLLEVYRLKTY